MAATNKSESIQTRLETIQDKTLKILLQHLFDKGFKLFGGAVLSMLKKKTPRDLDLLMGEDMLNRDMRTALASLSLMFRFKHVSTAENYIGDRAVYTYKITSKVDPDWSIDLDFVRPVIFESALDVDVNGLIMTEFDQIQCIHKGLDLPSVLQHVFTKRFDIKLKRPDGCDTFEKFKWHVKCDYRLAKILNKGFLPADLKDQNPTPTTVLLHLDQTNQLFATEEKKNLLVVRSTKQSNCFLCDEILTEDYVYGQPCCSKQAHFGCAYKKVVEEFSRVCGRTSQKLQDKNVPIRCSACNQTF